MRLDFITALPGIFTSPLNESILKRAREAGCVDYFVHDLHAFAHDKYKTIDDAPFGGGAGMILKCEPIFECIESLQAQRTYDEIIYLAPDGELLSQALANRLSLYENIILLCGHYKGIDERVRQTVVTKEISIGEYVVTGGELPALVVADAIVRLLPGAMHDSDSALRDSYQNDGMLDCPHYTRPRDFRGLTVPGVLLEGNHKEIEQWRAEQSVLRTNARIRTPKN